MHRASCLSVLAAAAVVVLAGCDRAQEERAADAASQAVRQTNKALNKAEDVAREGLREAGQVARKAGDIAQEGAQEAGRVLSDGTLTAKVKTALLADEGVPGSSIDVDSSAGVVTLTGQLVSQAQVDRAVGIARNIEGVERVENRLSAQAG
jgi:hyperosmotically inducible periplasmic protein